jgi:hypothetical protein
VYELHVVSLHIPTGQTRQLRARRGTRSILLAATAMHVIAAATAPALAQDSAAVVPTYESSALQALLNDASRVNAHIPPGLHAYRASVESEMSLVLIDSAGRERTAQLEQIASEVRWRAADRYDQRVVGYRTQAVGPTFSLMTMFGGWTTPTLYGNRLQLGVTPRSVAIAPAGATTAGLTTHPLSETREEYYTFSGGDTAVVLYSRGRRIPVVNVRVTPRPGFAGSALLFAGDLHLDAERKHLVSMRGRLVELRDGRAISTGNRVFGATGTTFVEMINAETDGEYWLPATQRTEFHAHVTLLGRFRIILRVVSRFTDHRTNDSSWAPGADAGVRHNLTFAPSDSLTRFADWESALGEATAETHYAEFEEFMPEEWRTSGARGVRFRPETFSELFRFNRVEGVFTGAAVELPRRTADSGLAARASLGWAWAEGVPRGQLTINHARGPWLTGVRLQRSLAHTNDFQLPLSWGATLSALFGSVDDFDYLDRRAATAFVERRFGVQRRSVFRLEAGPAGDHVVEQNVSRGLYVEGEGFRPNRGIWQGNYVRTAATMEINPNVSGLFVDRGFGGRLYYERADGDLQWQRLEARLALRRELGPLDLYARGDAGTLLGAPAPQVMFEIGRSEGLRSYDYKEFAGDRAAMLRATVAYTFPLLRAPLRVGGGLFLPGLAPGLAVGLHGGWTDISGSAAEQALLALGSRVDETGAQVPLSRTTDGVRGSAEVLLTFFSGTLGIGVTRPIDHSAPWRFTARIGQGF